MFKLADHVGKLVRHRAVRQAAVRIRRLPIVGELAVAADVEALPELVAQLAVVAQDRALVVERVRSLLSVSARAVSLGLLGAPRILC